MSVFQEVLTKEGNSFLKFNRKNKITEFCQISMTIHKSQAKCPEFPSA